jgi:hypothetical protein
MPSVAFSKWRLLQIVPLLAVPVCGCGTTTRSGDARKPCCVVYYLDGAGGGGILANWGRGVRQGFRTAGYQGEFINFSWQTGLGAAADQDASVGYKRLKAAKLAGAVARYTGGDAGTEVSLIALSAGAAVAVYTLEALPPGCEVHDLVLLGASVSAQYDLTRALRHVRHQAYVFTSDRDEILRAFVPVLGTADREFCGLCAAGLYGFRLPPRAGEETRRLYSKIRHIAWRPEFELDGNQGGHLGYVDSTFVRNRIAPLVLHEGPQFTRVAAGVAEWPKTQPASTRPQAN